jgi:type IV pilus assembly protein PilN
VIRINLLPPEYEAAQQKKEQQIYFGGAGAFLVLVLASVWLIQAQRASALETKILNAQAELAKYQAIVSQLEKIEQDKTRLSAKRDVIRSLNQARLAYPVMFEDLLPLIPSDCWTTSISITEQGGNMKVVMNSRAMSNFALATWLTNLQQSKHFSAIELSAISYAAREGGGGGQTLSFSITSMYKHQGPFPLEEYN